MKVSRAFENMLQISMLHIAEIQREINFVLPMLQIPSMWGSHLHQLIKNY